MNKSLWLDTINQQTYPTLNEDITTDILVIGGGITGISCAYELLKANKKVVLVDASRLMHGTTGKTTSKLTIQHSLIYDNLLTKLGFEDAFLYQDINTKAIDRVKELSELHHIDCNFKPSFASIYTSRNRHIDDIEREYEAAITLGIDAKLTTQLSLPYSIKRAVSFANQAEFHVTKYLTGLINQLNELNCEIFEQTKVIEVVEDESGCISRLLNGKTIRSKQVIMASHYPCHKSKDLYFTKLIPKFSYVMAFKTDKTIEDDMIINVAKPIRSLRKAMYQNEEILLVAGESHGAVKTRDKERHFDHLYQYADQFFKVKQEFYRWSTMDYSTPDQIPMIGQANKAYSNVYVATGFGKWGMTKGIAASLVLRDIIAEGSSDYEELFDPCRKSSILSKKFIVYNLKQPYKFIKSKLLVTEALDNLALNEQKMVKINKKNYGAYKDSDGKVTLVDVTCPHLKCTLRYNNAEQTYDCMCHGSRFDMRGAYLDGPSKHDLKQLDPNMLDILETESSE